MATRLFTRSLRYMMMFAALGAALGALLMFWLGASKLLHAVRSGAVADPLATTTMVTSVMGGTDAFLFGVVLIAGALRLLGPDAGHRPADLSHGTTETTS